MHTLRAGLGALVVGLATALVIIAVSILPFLNPLWVGFEQQRADAAGWTGYAPADLQTATNAILVDLIVGPPDFDVTVNGVAVLEPRERAHMRDVRTVFAGFYLVAAVALLVLIGAALLARAKGTLAVLWRRVARGALATGIATVASGIVALTSFDAAFELFHELFFPPGSFLFDPRTDRLVQLFPEQFWVETTIAVGVVVIVLAFVLAVIGRRRAAAIDAQAARTPGSLSAVPIR
jgi:integral membrane protein (TIGR01906 family)